MLGDVNKLFLFKSLLTTPSNVLPLHHKQTIPPIILIFTESEGDGIKTRLPFKIFSTLKGFIKISWNWHSIKFIFPFPGFQRCQSLTNCFYDGFRRNAKISNKNIRHINYDTRGTFPSKVCRYINVYFNSLHSLGSIFRIT